MKAKKMQAEGGKKKTHNMIQTNNSAVKVKNIALPVNRLDSADGLNLMRVPR